MKLNHQTQLLAVAIVTLIATVFVLDYYGYLRHSNESDAIYMAEFSLIANVPGQDQYVSHIPAKKRARCIDHYLVLESTEKAGATGLLVDKKQRPVRCEFNGEL
ncbi:MAG: hypothetical protein B0D91_04020 [Oceanospirillales bacterium LUC14_002_19_P2]|nr:MAG: hypothetical protein B0D91_04020 [Oceanospirillales bacterium LUC14_002_19_P2]